MSDGLLVTIMRTRESSELGATSFAIDIGQSGWAIELNELAQLISRYGDLEKLLRLPIGAWAQICLEARIVEQPKKDVSDV